MPKIINACDRCKNRENRLVNPNVGASECDVLIVGGSPYMADIHSPLGPMKGRRKLALDHLLTYAGVDIRKKKIGFSNASRCPTSHLSDTEAAKVQRYCFKHYTKEFIEKIKPKLIITLGDIPLKLVHGNTTMTKVGGRVIESSKFGVPTLATHDLQTVLEMPFGDSMLASSLSMRAVSVYPMRTAQIVSHFYTLGCYLKEDYPKTTSILASEPADLEEILSANVFSIDLEGTGVDPHSSEMKILSISFSSKEGYSKVVDFRDYDDHTKHPLWDFVKELLTKKGAVKVVAYRPFEEDMFLLKWGVKMVGPIIDVLAMAHVLDENNTKYSLEHVANHYTDLKNIKDVAEGYRTNLIEAPTEVLVQYNGTDTDATLRAFNKMKERMKEISSLRRYYKKFIQPVQNMMSFISLTGCRIDQARLSANEQILDEIIVSTEAEALEQVPQSIKDMYAEDIEKIGVDDHILTKSNFVTDYLFRHKDGLRLKPKKLTGVTKAPSITEDHFAMFQDMHFIRLLLRFKKALKLRNTYVRRLWDVIREDGLIYPRLGITTVTGRTTIRDPELQTYPKHGEFAPLIRAAFIPKEEGWLFGARDLSQSEIRIMGWLAKDKSILTALKNGVDIHTNTAAVVNGIPIGDVTKDMRQKAKAINFGFLYGMQAKGFREYARKEYGLELTLEECVTVREEYFEEPRGYYALPKYHASKGGEIRRMGLVHSPLGRSRRLPLASSDDWQIRSKAERQAINFATQAFSSDLGLLAMALFQRRINNDPELKDKVEILWFIHDEIMFQAHESVMAVAQAVLKDCIEVEAPAYIQANFGVHVGYPIASEGSVGPRWSEMEEIEDAG